MRASSDIDEEKQRLTVTFVGNVTFQEIIEWNRLKTAASVLNYPLLIDGRKAHLSVGDESLGDYVTMYQANASRSRLAPIAVVVDSESEAVLLEKLLSHATQWVKSRIFLDIDEARRWLGWS